MSSSLLVWNKSNKISKDKQFFLQDNGLIKKKDKRCGNIHGMSSYTWVP